MVQVDAASNRIAHYLRSRAGVSAGAVVCVLLQRSPLLVVALLGVLKSGAAYLTLDRHDCSSDWWQEGTGAKVGKNSNVRPPDL